MSSRLGLLLFMLGFGFPVHATAGEWNLGVAANTGARGEIRPCT
jgi:hypothetical protein